ncbi:FAD-dependent oxidoreductase [Actinospongicola halichondriae]|uniref:FAD-dependent oxidoreductase n=1 Tax=Actinospongicola halichondriae TaxID=3236844 RepID=UPI003D55A083
MSERLLVIGGDAGGMAAASQARRRQPYMEIVALEKGNRTSYSACGIPYLVAGDVQSPDDLVARTPEEFRDKHRIDVRMHHEVMGIDLDARKVEVYDHARQRTFQLGFDLLQIGTGARPIRPDIPGIDLPHVLGVQTVDDGVALLERARQSQCRKVAVIGGGYIGIEMAEAFIRWGAEVTLIEGNDQVMRTFDPDMAAPIARAMRSHGVDVRLGVRALGFDEKHVLTDDGPIAADLVVLGLGVTPNSELAGEAGVTLGVRNAIRVNRRQQTSKPGVYAAGDCAESFHRVSKRQVHVALGTVANKQGRVAGINLGGGYATFPGVVGTAITKVCATEMARTGLNESEADRNGFVYESVTISSTTRAGYYPDTKPISIKLLAERGSRRVLGAQIVGEEGAAKRIDVLATAITAEMTVDDVVDLDLAYAPPFSGVWDAVHIAARKAAQALDATEQT